MSVDPKCAPEYISYLCLLCHRHNSPSTVPPQPNPLFTQHSMRTVWRVLGRRFKLLSVEHLFHFLDLCRFFCSLFLLADIIWWGVATVPPHTLSVSLCLGQQKQVLYLLNMALFVAFPCLASICRSIALQMNQGIEAAAS